MKALLTTLALVAVALSGCTDDGGEIEPDDIPVAISREQVEELEARILEEHPREFAFPGQSLAEPVVRFINETLSPGTGMGLEPINDESVADFGGTIVVHDISDLVPANQPVEIRAALKWFGDPGASADVDFYINVPGTKTTFSDRNEESWNWAIINKQAVLNTARIEGEPFEIGLQVQNGKIIHPDGMRYQIEITAHFVEGVIAPYIPWAVTVPEGATGLIIESEPVTGDEHVTTEMIIVSPSDTIHRAVVHNDIGTETLFIPVRAPGEYVVYISEQHGGFVRLETDIPNPAFEARALTKTVEVRSLHSGVIMAPAPDGYGEEGVIDTGALPALDVRAYIGGSPLALEGDVQIDVLSGGNVVHSLLAQGTVHGDEGRLGQAVVEHSDRKLITPEGFSYGLRGNVGLGGDVGVIVTGYQR